MNDILTIYFPTCWKIGNIYEWFSDNPEIEALEPTLVVGKDWLVND